MTPEILSVVRGVLVLAAFLIHIFTGLGDHSWVVVAILAFAYHGTFQIERSLEHRANRRIIESWRALGPAEQDAGIERMWSASGRQWLRDALQAEGTIEQDGNVERFPFSSLEQSEMRRDFWFAVIAAAGCLLAASFVDTIAQFWRYIIAVGGGLLGVNAVRTLAGLKYHATVLEVSPFRAAIRYPEGRTRYLTLDGPLELESNPKESRFELRRPGSTDFIPIDIERVGAERALELVIQYGGLEPISRAT